MGVSVHNPTSNQRGIAVFANVASVAITLVSQIVGAAYGLRFAAAVDTGAGPGAGTIPGVAYSGKTAAGFTIETTGLYTGTVDWEAIPL